MGNDAYEQLSALIDGELDESERRDILGRLTREAALKRRWERYHLISDALSRQLSVSVDAELAERVQRAVAATPDHHGAEPPTHWRFTKPLAGAVLAASIAAVAVVGVTWMAPGDDPVDEPTIVEHPIIQEIQPDVRHTDTRYVNVPRTRWEVSDRSMETRLQNYLMTHNEHSAMRSVHGMLPYARIAGFDSREEQQE